MRGGTSRGAFIKADDLPSDPGLRDRVLVRMYGSPEPRQIDGIGGADPLTSKVAIVSRSRRPDADVDYLFGQIRIGESIVDYRGNCGNIASGVAPFAIDEHLVRAVEPVTRVRIHNVNTGQLIVASVNVCNGKAMTSGTCSIAGVLGTAAPIALDFAGTACTLGRGLLPSGLARHTITLRGGRMREVSVVDAAAPVVFVDAAEIGIAPNTFREATLPEEAISELSEIRAAAAELLGLVESAEDAAETTPQIPKVYAVHEPTDFEDRFGRTVLAREITLLGRGLSMGAPHAAYALTAAVCTGAAACIPGTVVAEKASSPQGGSVRIGHPSGVTSVEIEVELSDREPPRLTRAVIERTARRIMSGSIYIPISAVEGSFERTRDSVLAPDRMGAGRMGM